MDALPIKKPPNIANTKTLIMMIYVRKKDTTLFFRQQFVTIFTFFGSKLTNDIGTTYALLHISQTSLGVSLLLL